ncbi:MAG TPA: glycosyltransferase family 4 protein [Pyrinomonadaceae bacterium]|jgi:glycosyltransferase involved in cell wall biosynthesis
MNLRATDTDTTDKPLRIAIVHYRDDAIAGGSLRVGETIANHVDPRKAEVHLVFAYGGEGPVAVGARVSCHFLKAKGPKDLLAWKRARAFFRELSPDLIHFQDAVVWLRTALSGTGYKTLMHIHGRHLPAQMSLMDRLLTRAFVRSTDAQAYISNGALDSTLELGWADPRRSFVVYNSIDCEKFSGVADKVAARAHLGLPENALLLGMVCRLVWEKGCVDLLSIIERLPDKWHGVFCGDGPQRAELEQQCKERNLLHRIHFLGVKPDVVGVYAALDAYAFLSRYESFGLVIAEAMACGVPVFGLGGHGEYREPEFPLITKQNSIFVERVRAHNYCSPEDPQVLNELAAKIADYGEHPEQYQEQIKYARTWVQTRFDARIQAEATMQVYKHVCSSSESNGLSNLGPYEIKPTSISF